MILTPQLLVTLATLCAADYEPTPAGQIINAGNDIRAVLEPIGEYLAVSVRGTLIKSIRNIRTDLDAFPVGSNGFGTVPRGFYNATVSLLPLIGPYVEGRRVITCGHSLGGSIAIQIAASLVRTGRTVAAYAAFEPACAGEDALAAVLAGVEGYISWFGNDPVPLLPPLFKHPCPVTVIGHDKLDPFECHEISGVVGWLREAARQAVAA